MRPRALLLALLTLAAAACGATGGGPHAPPPPAVVVQAGSQVQSDRMLVRRASVRIAADRPDTLAGRVEASVRAAGGYVQRSAVRERERLTMTVHVPAAGLDAFLAGLDALGEVEDRTVLAEDVTMAAVDLEARVRNLTTVRDRLRGLLQRAEKVGDVVEVERELGRVQGELDSLEARLTRMRSQVAMAEVGLTIEQKQVLGPLGLLLNGIFWLIGKLFVIR